MFRRQPLTLSVRPALPARGRVAGGVADTQYALRFPSNVSGSDTAAPYAVIRFDSPHSNGLPAWGPANAGVTVIRKIKGYQQTGYYARLWYTRNDTTFDGQCWGAHPYPFSQDNTGTTHKDEIAADSGDYFDYQGSSSPGNGHTVVQEVVYTQAMRCTYNSSSDHVMRDYHSLPAVTTSDYVERTITASGFMDTMSNGSQFVIGDSPWFAGFQHERASMDLYAIKIIGAAMTESDILLESADMNTLVTATAQTSIWWGKKSFATVDSLTCDFGTGRSFTRVDSSNLLSVVAV